jgi:hypothetical protein
MSLDFLAAGSFGKVNFVRHLEIQPELRSVSEVPSQAQRGVASNAAALVDDLTRPRDGDMQITRECVDAEPKRSHKLNYPPPEAA